ncbi:MAG: hypothetical protein U0175_21060 [Caldilineaceae bacterium]
MNNETSTSSTAFAIRRSLLVTFGDEALDVANQTVQISRQWLQVDPLPMQIADGASDSSCEAILKGCNGLADARLAQQWQGRGYTIKQRNEMDLWIILQLSSQQNEHTTVSHLNGDELAAWIEESSRQVHAALKVQLTVNLFLLCEPQAQPLALPWANKLRNLCEERIYLCGPVNQQHLRVENWLHDSARTLAGLLWSERSAPGAKHWHELESCWVTVAGADGWRAPNLELQKWLAVEWCERQLVLLEGNARVERAAPPTWLLSLETLERDLLTHVTPVPHPQDRSGQRPRWEQLATYPSQLLNGIQRLFMGRTIQQRAARNQWLAKQLARCEPYSSTTSLNHGIRNAPSVNALRQEIATLSTALTQLCDEVDRRLSAVEADLKEQEESCRQAQTKLQAMCDQFPSLTIPGILSALVMPWRWWRWALLYAFELPEQIQQLRNAELAKAEIVWEQENTLTIRQFVLALLQDAQCQEQWLTHVEQRISALKQRIAEQKSQIGQPALLPWSSERLQWLANEVSATVASWSQPWLTLPNLVNSEANPLYEACWQRALSYNEAVLHSSATSLLEGALPDLQQRQQWLQQLWENATPLWPSDELLPNEDPIDWLLLTEADTDMLNDLMPMSPRIGYCHFVGVLVVRKVAVNLGVESFLQSDM